MRSSLLLMSSRRVANSLSTLSFVANAVSLRTELTFWEVSAWSLTFCDWKKYCEINNCHDPLNKIMKLIKKCPPKHSWTPLPLITAVLPAVSSEHELLLLLLLFNSKLDRKNSFSQHIRFFFSSFCSLLSVIVCYKFSRHMAAFLGRMKYLPCCHTLSSPFLDFQLTGYHELS